MDRLIRAVDKQKQFILDAERAVWATPETGYKEFKTNKYMADAFITLGYELTFAEGITGFYTTVDTGNDGPTVLVLAELDSVICPTHTECDKETGAVHACGHNAQCAALLGLAAALKEDGVLENLSGKIMLCAVPAEEFLEIEYRLELKKQGKIKYLGGKSEFLSRGYFDSVDIAFMVHTMDFNGVNAGSVGFIAKNITYKGVSAHAGGSPWEGVNALYAANLGLNAVNALRETFKEEDIIRVHPIITSGGEIVNAIPDTVRLESYIRGKSFSAITKANKKVNRALSGAALSLGANVDIADMSGYAPLINDKNMCLLAKDAANTVMPEAEFTVSDSVNSISTDMGDLSGVMPVVHPYISGMSGKLHGSDFCIENPEQACVNSAKLQLVMLHLLLKDGAKRAKQIIAEFKPTFKSKEEYLDFVDKINASGDRIEYSDLEAKIKL